MPLNEYIAKIFYDANGHTGNVYYYRFVKDINGYIYDAVNKVLSANPTWADSAIAMAEINTNTGAFPMVVPTGLPVGRYDAIVYKQVGSTPQNTDDVQDKITVTKGDIFNF